MAATNVIIQNSADKSFHYAHAVGTGAPADTDALATDLLHFPIGSEYIDTAGKKLYVRVAATKKAADWVAVNAA